VDELIESIDVKDHEKLIPSIFKFFETYPLDDCGAPGSLVHLTESYYPSYKALLFNSLQKQPSVNTILMVNRILNSALSDIERNEYLSLLKSVASNDNVATELKNEAKDYIDYQTEKSS